MRVVITGAGGMLGSDVAALARSRGHEVTALTREQLDITDPARVDRAIAQAKPAAVINCAAYTDVDGAEADRATASQVNGEGAGFVAGAAAAIEAKVVQVSTDYVFDGHKREPYTEGDHPSPLQAYGITKLAGEKAVSLVNKRHFIVRTSWLFGPGGPNFVETMLRTGADGGPITVVHDQVGCPTYTGHLADGVIRLVEGTSYGIHHMAGGGSCSWYEFATEIFRQAELETKLLAISSREYPRAAERPARSVLRSARSLAIELPPWQRGLADYLKRTRPRDAVESAS